MHRIMDFALKPLLPLSGFAVGVPVGLTGVGGALPILRRRLLEFARRRPASADFSGRTAQITVLAGSLPAIAPGGLLAAVLLTGGKLILA